METLAFYLVETISMVTALDLGTVAPQSSDDTQLRVLNLSDLYQAKDVSVSLTGTDAVQLWLSVDGDTFADSVALGDIPPGATSATFWLRRVTASTDGPGGYAAALAAVPAGWSSPTDTSTTPNIPLDTKD